MAVSLSLLRDDAEAEDNTQDTLLKLWTIRAQLHQYRNPSALATTICKNLAITKLRQKHPQILALNEELQLLSQRNAQWILEDKENAQWMADTINGLPASQMTILKMSQRDGLEYKEIATILGINETTVRTAISKARKQLLEKLEQRNQERRKHHDTPT